MPAGNAIFSILNVFWAQNFTAELAAELALYLSVFDITCLHLLVHER